MSDARLGRATRRRGSSLPTLRALLFGATVGAVGCGSSDSAGDGAPTGTAPPVSVVNEQRTHAKPAVDAPFTTLVPTFFRTPDVLPSLDVRALAVVGADVYAGTAGGLAKLRADGSAFDAVATNGTGPVVDLARAAADRLVVAQADRVEVRASGGGPGDSWAVSGESIAAVAAHGSDVLFASEKGVSRISASGAKPVAALQGVAVRDLAVQGDVLVVATDAGVRRYDLASDTPLADWTAPGALPDDDVRAVAPTSDGSAIVAATATGYARIASDGTATIATAGVGALPEGDVRAIAEHAGEVVLGHAIGVTTLGSGSSHHLHGLRWIPAEQVNAIALADDGTPWVGTPGGVARLAPTTTTLADKAAALEAQTSLYERMDGFMADQIAYADPWDHTGEPFRGDEDNDGLWTEMQIGAWCLAYATTKDESYYQKAKKALDVMMLEIDVPGATFEAQGKKRGFVTRSLVREDEGSIFDEKKTQPNWHLQSYGSKSYYWKDDTSSDEYTGHFFGIPLYYDLCAKTDDEKAIIREHLDAVMGYVVDNGYLLVDLDGKPTSFGDWTGLANAVDGLGACLAARSTRCAESFGGGGWLDSIEILGYLLAAWHVTGDARYYDEYLRLAVDERYGEMVAVKDTTLTVTDRTVQNHSDHELAALAYFTLLRYEPDPTRRATWAGSLRDFQAREKPERNALELGVLASAVDDMDAEVAAQTLREIPADRRTWLADNAHRKDAKLDKLVDRFDEAQFETVFAYDELGELEWNGNLYAVKQGGDGRGVQGVWPFLLPYWMARYYGALP